MRSAFLVLAAALALAACDSGGASGPDFVAFLDAAQTVPLLPPAQERGATGYASFRVLADGRVEYTIQLQGLDVGGIKGQAQTPDPSDDVTQIHFHVAGPGQTGPHALNVFGGPIEDDGDMTFNAEAGVVRGVWDRGDLTPPGNGIPNFGQSQRLDAMRPNLCAGQLYVNVHTPYFTTGEVRGQVVPVETTGCP